MEQWRGGGQDETCEVIAEKQSPVVTGLGAVWVLFLLSAGSAGVAFVGLALVSVAFGWPVAVPVAGSGVALVGCWCWWIAKTEGLLWVTETIRRVVPVASAPTPAAVDAPPVVQVELHEPDRGRWAYLELPGTPESLATMARGLLSGRPFSESEWTGARAPYSKAEFRSLRAQLLERGVVAWRDPDAPAQGCQLTAAGRAVFRSLVDVPQLDARTHARARAGGQIAAGEAFGQGGDE